LQNASKNIQVAIFYANQERPINHIGANPVVMQDDDVVSLPVVV
jgi:hypothetical protein